MQAKGVVSVVNASYKSFMAFKADLKSRIGVTEDNVYTSPIIL